MARDFSKVAPERPAFLPSYWGASFTHTSGYGGVQSGLQRADRPLCGASIITTHEAFDDLISARPVTTKPGRGFFVARPQRLVTHGFALTMMILLALFASIVVSAMFTHLTSTHFVSSATTVTTAPASSVKTATWSTVVTDGGTIGAVVFWDGSAVLCNASTDPAASAGAAHLTCDWSTFDTTPDASATSDFMTKFGITVGVSNGTREVALLVPGSPSHFVISDQPVAAS